MEQELPAGPLAGVSICVLANSTLTFHERFKMEIEALLEAGARISVITRWPDPAALPDGLPHHDLPAPLADSIPVSHAAWRPRRIAENLSRNLLRKVVRLVVDPWYARTHGLRLLQRLAEGADILWVLDYENLAGAVRVAGRSGVCVLYETIDLVPEYHHLGPSFQRKARRTERRLIPYIDGFITACDSYADYYEEKYGDLPAFRRPVVHDNAPRQRVGQIRPSSEPLKFLFLGALTFDRPIAELIEACALAHCHFVFTFQGENYLGSSPQDQINRLNVAGKIRILEPCPPDQVVDVASAYDVGVAALRGLNENERRASTSKLFTYMAAGLAILGSDLPGIARVVNQHRNGSLVPDMSPVAWAAALDAMAGLPLDFVDELKRHSLEAAGQYAWERQKEAFVAEFVRVASGGESCSGTGTRPARSLPWTDSGVALENTARESLARQ